jgi:uncharacterized FlaG/YvyC family protein
MNRKLNEERHRQEEVQEKHREEKKKKHRVRSNHWVKGVLKIIDKVFDTLEEAVEYAEGLDCTSAKIYDADNCVVRECHSKHKDKDHHTYA